WGELVSGNYFDVLGIKPVVGRTFTREEDGNRPGAYPVVVISHRLWRTRFHSDPAVAGKALRVNRRPLAIAGVAPPDFHGTMPGLAFDIWMPVTMGVALGEFDDSVFRYRGYRNLYALVRLKPGVTIAQARAEAAAVARNFAREYPQTNRLVQATVLPLWEMHTGAPELLLGPLRILMAVSALVLLIVCANVANLLLARSIARRRELAVRLALGAGRARLARQLLTETFVLAGAGALAALPIASWMADSLPSLVPNVGVSVAFGFALNARILVFTVLVCVVTALAAGAAPALLSLRGDVNETLKSGGRSGMAGAGSHRARGILVVTEVALATVALVGAGLFLRSFHNARRVDPGFDRDNVLLARFYLRSSAYSRQEIRQFFLRLSERLQTSPGVRDVSYSDFAPLGSSAGPYTSIEVEGYAPGRDEPMNVNRSFVAPGYFRVLRIPLAAGREFNRADDARSAPVVIVNRMFARRFFHGADPLGRRIRCWGQWHTVVGLARDTKHYDPVGPPLAHFYVPILQRDSGLDAYVFIRTYGDPTRALSSLRREVAAAGPDAGAYHAMTLMDWTEVTLLPQKVAASLLGVLGLISLTLAAVGLYSVMSYAVTQRTQEIGVRMALGARPREVLLRVLRAGMGLTAAGLAIGFAGAFAVTRLAASMLINVSPADPATFGGVALFLAAVATLATFLPAWRATKVDPMVALRWE
ncbi:MAG TPA: ABC transporter permease, partial [Bryobacteraceae bacterium]|nr:ABC transporter permease [Bryobacteraceae bacterium]